MPAVGAGLTAGFAGRSLRRLRCLYGRAGRGVRWHVRIRFQLAPFRALLETCRRPLRILDIGCGHGLFLLLAAGEGMLASGTGLDPDPHKIAGARSATPVEWNSRLAWTVSDASTLPAGPFDLVSLIDVLYLIPPAQWEALFGAALRSLSPGGRVMILTSSDRPHWKAAWNRIEERVAVGVLGITRGAGLHWMPPEAVTRRLHSAGFRVARRPLDIARPHPFHLIEGQREA